MRRTTDGIPARPPCLTRHLGYQGMSVEHTTTSDPVRYEIHPDWPAFRVGDDGSIWSRKRPGGGKGYGEWHPIKPIRLRSGHMQIGIGWIGGKFVRDYVHRMVLTCFVGRAPEGMECRHLDGDPSNNSLPNLAWGSSKENFEDSVRHGTAHCLTLTPEVGILDADGVRKVVELLKEGRAPRDVAELMGVSYSTVNNIANGRGRCAESGIDPETAVGRRRNRMTPEDARAMVAAKRAGATVTEIAKKFDYPTSSVCRVLKGVLWASATGLGPAKRRASRLHQDSITSPRSPRIVRQVDVAAVTVMINDNRDGVPMPDLRTGSLG